MKTPTITLKNNRLMALLVSLFAMLAIASCGSSVGDGSSNTGSGGGSTDDFTISYSASGDAFISTPSGNVGSNEKTFGFIIRDANNEVVQDVSVTFSISGSATGTNISSSTTTSDASGVVQAVVAGGGTEGAFTVSATIVGTSISDTSPSISVVGPRAESLTVSSISAESLNLDGGTGNTSSVITLLVAYSVDNTPIPDQTVSFSLIDLQDTMSSIDATSAITDSNGLVSVTLNSGSAEGTVNVNAQVDGLNAFLGGSALSTTSTDISISALTTDQITFVSTETSNLAYSNSRGISQTELVFSVIGQSGTPLPGIDVDFSVNAPSGTGITLSSETDITDSSGQVSVIAGSGTVPTAFSVVATVSSDDSISVSSPQIAVSSGLPIKGSFSLTVSLLNPANAHDTDGVEVSVNARLADYVGNPVPDGTTVTFSAEGGRIPGSCITANGECSVDWVSQNPRPGNGDLTILAYTEGVESFVDSNGNFVYESGTGDVFTAGIDDLGEAFRDDDESRSFDTNEPFIDVDDGIDANGELSKDGLRNGGDGVWTTDGVLVFENVTIYLSDDQPQLVSTTFALNSTIDVSGAQQDLVITISDSNGNSLPIGTTLDYEIDNGEIVGLSSFEVGNQSGITNASIKIKKDDTPDQTGNLILTITTPDGSITQWFWTIDDDPTP